MNRDATPENVHDPRIPTCLRLIEQQLNWGPSSGWNNYDFSKLSDEVHQRTHVRLSITTLKRIWGKVKYESAPTLTTLNVLAQFAGFADWRDFCRQQAPNIPSVTAKADEERTPTIPPVVHPTTSTRSWRGYAFLIVVPIVVVAFFLFSSPREKQKLDPADFQFEANKVVAEGVPNSVIFTYDATAAPSDSLYIVQTWDIRRKKLVSRNNHNHSAIYYYPGFFRTKLIVDNEIVRTHDLFVTSNGWLCLAENDPIPLYFKKEETVLNDRVEVDAALLTKYNLSLNPKPPRIRIFNQGDLGALRNDNFAFETQIKNDFSDGTGACQFVEVLIQCKDDIAIIPLSAKTCVGDLALYFCGKQANSQEADLSKFGTDLHQWTKLRVEAKSKHVTFFVNDEKAYELDFPNSPTDIVGVQYRFPGVGAVKDTWFESNGRRITL